MRLSPTDQNFKRTGNVNFSGNQTRYISGKSFAWFESIDGFKQRAALGTAALLFQPAIDYANPMADEKTRKFSVLKTVVKAVVGTVTGLLIRKAGSKYIEHLLNNPQKLFAKMKDSKLKDSIKEIMKSAEQKKKFSDNLGTALGLIGVAIGDFTFDMPIARYAIQHTSQALGMSDPESKGGKK